MCCFKILFKNNENPIKIYCKCPNDHHPPTYPSIRIFTLIIKNKTTVFSGLLTATFCQKFQGSGLYSGVAYVQTFPKTTHHTPHAMACLDQHLITISSPTVLRNHWLSLQPCGHPSPARRVSLSLSVCVCVVSHSNGSQLHCSTWRPSTARTG